jgi:hypothetical protein
LRPSQWALCCHICRQRRVEHCFYPASPLALTYPPFGARPRHTTGSGARRALGGGLGLSVSIRNNLNNSNDNSLNATTFVFGPSSGFSALSVNFYHSSPRATSGSIVAPLNSGRFAHRAHPGKPATLALPCERASSGLHCPRRKPYLAHSRLWDSEFPTQCSLVSVLHASPPHVLVYLQIRPPLPLCAQFPSLLVCPPLPFLFLFLPLAPSSARTRPTTGSRARRTRRAIFGGQPRRKGS